MKELQSLIKDVNPDVRRRGTEFNFAIGKYFNRQNSNEIYIILVAPDRYSARYTLREVGITISGQRAPDDDKTVILILFKIFI